MNIQPTEHEAVGAMAALAAATQGSTQLITLDPAKYVAEVFKPFNDKFSILKAEADTITPDASTPAGMEICIKYRAGFRDDVRVGGEKARVDRKAPILQIGKLLDSEYRKLADAVAPYEAKFHNAIEAEKKRKEELKAAEAARKEALRQRVVAIRELPVTAVGKSSAEIGLMLAALEADVPDETFGDLLDAAKVARVEVMTKLATLQAAVSASEAEATRVAAAMAELAQMRAEAAERARLAQIEADRIAAERQAEDQRRAALVAEQEAEALRQREVQAAELKKQADAQAERNRQEQAEIARQRQELLDMQADAKAKADAEAARLAEAAEQAERSRVAADTKRQLEQQAADIAAARGAEPVTAPAVAPASAAPEIARTAAFYKEVATHRSAPAAKPAPVETLFDDMADAGPTDEQIIAFFAEHDMDIDEAVPRLERFIADVRAGALADA